jgi:hypothetical protein
MPKVLIGLAELGDIVGDPAAALLRDAGMQLGEELFDRSEENSSSAFRRARGVIDVVQTDPQTGFRSGNGAEPNKDARWV